MFRSTRSLHLPTRELPLSPDTTMVLHQVYNLLLGLLGRAKLYVDASVHGTTKLVQYFSFMTYCLISKTEKLMFTGYFMDLWNLFQVRPPENATDVKMLDFIKWAELNQPYLNYLRDFNFSVNLIIQIKYMEIKPRPLPEEPVFEVFDLCMTAGSCFDQL